VSLTDRERERERERESQPMRKTQVGLMRKKHIMSRTQQHCREREGEIEREGHE
jgi:hypothetical protein